MPDEPIIAPPSSFITQHAIAFGQLGATAIAVDAGHPLPIAATITPSGATPLAGSSAASTVAGPFTPVLGRAINLTLSGTWTGNAQLLRSTDGGTSKLPITIGGQPWATFISNCNEAVAEESESGATYYLALTIASGTVSYRVAQ